MVEPLIATPAGNRKPDIVAWIPGSRAVVTDVTIASDNCVLNAVHELKSKYYDVPEIRQWAADRAGCKESDVKFSAIAYNWRGAVSKKSAVDLCQFGFSMDQLRLLSVVVLEVLPCMSVPKDQLSDKSRSNESSTVRRPWVRRPWDDRHSPGSSPGELG